jgi:hypothetical protein
MINVDWEKELQCIKEYSKAKSESLDQNDNAEERVKTSE